MQKTIRRQSEAFHFARAFAAGAYHIMVWAGPPGLSKTRTIEAALGKGHFVYLSGDVSPYQLYKEVYAHRDASRIVIDDVESLIRNPLGTQLLKAFCQTEDVKTVGWLKANKEMEKEGIPRRYETTARFCLLCNDEDAIKRHLGPVIDRGVLVRFRFSAQEVHRMVGEWLDHNQIDREVYDFIGSHLAYAKSPSARLYRTATETKTRNPGIDWREAVLETFGLDEDEVEVARLFSDETYPSNAARWAEFHRRGFGSRAKFYRLAREMGLVGAAHDDDRGDDHAEAAPVSPEIPAATPPLDPSLVMEALGFGTTYLTRPDVPPTSKTGGKPRPVCVDPEKTLHLERILFEGARPKRRAEVRAPRRFEQVTATRAS